MDNLYTYEIITKDRTDLIQGASNCLAKAFTGIEVGGKWIQCPLIGYAGITYDDFYQFCKNYLEIHVEQGYCAAALDNNNRVVGAIAGDTNAPEVIEEETIYGGTSPNWSIVIHALNDVNSRFLDDYQNKKRKTIQDGQLLHMFMIGVIAERESHQVTRQLFDMILEKASSKRLQFAIGECTNPKSMRALEKNFGIHKYEDINGNHIAYHYKENDILKNIPEDVAEGIYVILKEF
ncbi:MAG: hypothetical protein FWE02_02590 [Defluviitaleaceae bacterium]|nr:hypothetical protein [Defluviitaleaceae bacterium]